MKIKTKLQTRTFKRKAKKYFSYYTTLPLPIKKFLRIKEDVYWEVDEKNGRVIINKNRD